MRYFSDVTNKFYDTIEACQKAEIEAKNLERIRKEREETAAKEKKAREEKIASERKQRAKEVEDARKAMNAAQSHYREVLEAFVRDYKTYHYSIDEEEAKKVIPTLFDLFNPFFF